MDPKTESSGSLFAFCEVREKTNKMQQFAHDAWLQKPKAYLHLFACMEDAADLGWGVGGVVIDSIAAFQLRNLLLLICIQSVNYNSNTYNK